MTMRPSQLSMLCRVLLHLYFPFLFVIALAMIALVVYLASVLRVFWFVLPAVAPLLVVFGLTVLQFFAAARVLWIRPATRNEMELRLPRKKHPAVYAFVEEVARQRGVEAPQQIRAAADTVAYVYQDENDRSILVLGGLAIAALSQEALAGVIAHELGHFAAGDTRLSRRGFKRMAMIAVLENQFRGQWAAYVNPLLWILRLYHQWYLLVWAAHSRQQEYAADRQEVALVGKEVAAAALVHLTVPDRLPWVRLASIAETCAATSQPIDKIFAEQRRLAKQITRSEWEDALRKELKEKTGPWDSHPCLKERLAGLGVAPRKALELALSQAGPPARELFPDWEEIERKLTERLMTVFWEHHLAMMDLMQILSGGPGGRA